MCPHVCDPSCCLAASSHRFVAVCPHVCASLVLPGVEITGVASANVDSRRASALETALARLVDSNDVRGLVLSEVGMSLVRRAECGPLYQL